MVRLLGLTRGEVEEPREIASRSNLTSESSENGWLIRFFDSSFFCEWIAVSYLYKHDHSGVRDYLCNRMYTLPLQGIESYLFQVCYMMIHKPSPSLDKFVIDVCSKSLKIALKVHWFVLAELEDSDDNEGISRIQEKCQIAATLMGEWPPLIRPQNPPSSPGGKNQVLNKIFSSKQRLLSLTSSPTPQKSLSFSPSSGNNLQEDGSPQSPEENKLFKKFRPGPKVRDALLFRKSVEKDDDESEKDGFFKRFLRDNKGDEELGQKIRDAFLFRKSSEKYDEDSEKDNFFKRLLRDGKGDDEESEKDGFFRRLLRDSKAEDEDLASSSEGFFKRLFRDSKNDSDDKTHIKTSEDEEKEGFFRKFFREKFEEKKDGNDEGDIANSEEKCAKPAEEDEKEGFFKKFFKDKFDDKKDLNDKIEDGITNVEEEEPSDFSLFKRIFRVHPEDGKSSSANENNGGLFESSSPGTENFFRKLFRDRDRSIEDSELLGSKKQKEKHPGSPKQRNEKLGTKPPLPSNPSQFRKGAYHESLDFVLSLCETSFGLVDVFPVEDRKSALHEAAAAKGEAPLGLPLKGAGQDSSEAPPRANGIIPKASDALSGELWEVKKERIRQASIHGNLPGWDLRSVIVKSGDDCRQEHLAVQLISHFYDIFQEAGLPLWLRPYEVLCTSSYTALIETIPDTASLHSIKSRYPNISSLREFFIAKYQEDSPSFKLAQRNFVESMAGYSLVCYLLQVKDRHNGNLLMDEEGHIIHIDFGFMLSNSPGGVNFESAPFKLTRELLEVMDSDAEGIPSEFFDYFFYAFKASLLAVSMLSVLFFLDSGFPCFKGGPRTIQNLRKRFHLNLTEEQCVSLVLSLISSSLDAWRTRQYDYYQRVLNGIL
uniref:1-phosphatidylinositol 4-kinase n=1 Tax=Cajanus cajan TaxID=3821 RepID=A0A151SSY1_CAJCA|nr:Phosphatidylinositol 4-kinase [Cajanus cajan]